MASIWVGSKISANGAFPLAYEILIPIRTAAMTLTPPDCMTESAHQAWPTNTLASAGMRHRASEIAVVLHGIPHDLLGPGELAKGTNTANKLHWLNGTPLEPERRRKFGLHEIAFSIAARCVLFLNVPPSANSKGSAFACTELTADVVSAWFRFWGSKNDPGRDRKHPPPTVGHRITPPGKGLKSDPLFRAPACYKYCLPLHNNFVQCPFPTSTLCQTIHSITALGGMLFLVGPALSHAHTHISMPRTHAQTHTTTDAHTHTNIYATHTRTQLQTHRIHTPK